MARGSELGAVLAGSCFANGAGGAACRHVDGAAGPRAVVLDGSVDGRPGPAVLGGWHADGSCEPAELSELFCWAGSWGAVPGGWYVEGAGAGQELGPAVPDLVKGERGQRGPTPTPAREHQAMTQGAAGPLRKEPERRARHEDHKERRPDTDESGRARSPTAPPETQTAGT